MYIGHKQVFARIVAWLKGNGTAYDVGITLHQFPAVGEHAVGIVEMLQQVIVDITCRLFHTYQDVVNILNGALQRLLGIQYSLLPQCLVREIGQNAQRHCQQQQYLA